MLICGVAHAQILVVFEVDLPESAAADGPGWTDALRALTAKRAPASAKVLAREDVLALLPPAPDGVGRLSLAECEGDCALQTGRTLGVDLILTARMRRQGRVWYATVGLTRTEDGHLLAQSVARLADGRAALMKAATQALTLWQHKTPRDVRMAKRVYSSGAPTLMLKSNTPTVITVDGRPMGQTPLAIPVPLRHVRIEARADGFATQRMTVDVGPMSGRLDLRMEPVTGVVELDWPDEYRDASLWVDGRARTLSRRVRLTPGPHDVQVRSPCGDSPRVPVNVERAARHSLSLEIEARCPRLVLTGEAGMQIRVADTEYTIPATTHRLPEGRYRLELLRRVQPTHTVDVPPWAGDDLVVAVPRTPIDVGGELGWQHRGNAGGLAYLRILSHAREARRSRWGIHLGVGIALDDAPPDAPDKSFGGFFLGAQYRVPITGWLEWTVGMEGALVAIEDGAPVFFGVDTGLVFHLPHFAVGAGWGLAAHAQVQRWSDAHGLRLTFAFAD